MSNKNMSIEENRLMTFVNWPTDCPVDPVRVAKGGFYSTGKDLEVICNWCQKKITSWALGDQVMQKHRCLNPLCMFVLNPNDSGNIPMLPVPSNRTSSLCNSINRDSSDTLSSATPILSSPTTVPVDVKIEKYRLSTFKNWRVSYITPESLAKAGFYYNGASDNVKCAWCEIVVGQWEVGDDPFFEHQRLCPTCPKVQLGPNIEIASEGIRELGIQQIRSPKEPRFSSLDARLRTFASWSSGNVQTADCLAEAGFYYQGLADQVRCFHCNGGLRYWLSEDDPWYEHARWFPKCQFVQLVKGLQYVKNIQDQQRSDSTLQESNQSPIMTIDEAMATEYVQLVLQMGLNEGRIRSAMKRRLDKTGKPFQNAEALIEAVLDGQVDEEGPADIMVGTSLRRSSFPIPPTSRISEVYTSQVTSTKSPRVSFVETPSNTSVTDCRSDSMDVSTNQNKEEKGSHNDQSINDVDNSQVSLEEENRKLKDARLCKVCMDGEVGVVFLPCGHLVTCVQCAPGVTMCPLCRSSIKGFVRTFLS